MASFHAFRAGLFSGDPARHPLRADADGLAAIDAESLGRAFQAGPGNPLEGLEGRAALMRNLGAALRARPDLFGTDPPRIGGLHDRLIDQETADGLPAPAILAALLEGFGPIWPGRLRLGGVGLGDVWHHRLAAPGEPAPGLVPFHKLSQWLAYSLVEVFEDAGLRVTCLDDAHRPARVPQRRPPPGSRRPPAARPRARRRAAPGGARGRRGMARPHRRAAGPLGRPRPRPPAVAPTCPWPASSKAAPGPPAAASPPNSARMAARRSASPATAPCSERLPRHDREPAPAIARHPPPAGAAQADPAPPARNRHRRVPPPRPRDQPADGLRGHARPAAGNPAHRDAAGADGGAHPVRQEALLRVHPPRRRRHPGRHARPRALRPRRPCRPVPRPGRPGARRVLPEAARGRARPRSPWSWTRCSPPATPPPRRWSA